VGAEHPGFRCEVNEDEDERSQDVLTLKFFFNQRRKKGKTGQTFDTWRRVGQRKNGIPN